MKKRKAKQLLLIFIIIFLVYTPSIKAQENGWEEEGEAKYYYVDGKKVKGFQEIDGKTYFFSRINDNAMRTGSFQIDGIYYHFNEDGSMYTGLLTENGNTYYHDTDGKRLTGFQKIEGKIYFFSRINDNAMRTGSFQIDGIYYHFNEDGSMYTGILKENGNTYYHDTDGKRLTGFQKKKKKIYFFSRIGDNAMRTGTFWIDGPYYHFNEDGSMHTGFLEENGNTYYFDETGKRVSGFQKIDGKTYFFSRINDNPMRTGMFSIDGTICLFYETGEQEKGTKWIDWEDNKYYIINGIIQTQPTKIDGKYYAFDKNGIHQTKSFKDGNKEFIINSNGEVETVYHHISVYYNQKDSRWGNKKYGAKTFGGTGCAPTSMAMAFQTILNREILPTEIGNYLYYQTKEYNRKTAGSSGLAIIYATNQYNIKREGISSTNMLAEKLWEGKIVFAAMGDGKFGTKKWNHAIIMSGIRNGNQTYAIDPLIQANNGWIDINKIWNEKSKDADDKSGGYYLYALS